MMRANSFQKGFSSKQGIASVLLIAVLGGAYYVMSLGHVDAKFSQDHVTIKPGEPAELIYSVSRTKFGEATPIKGQEYLFRVEPNEANIEISPAIGLTNSSGEIPVIVTPKESFEGHTTIWVTNGKTHVENPAVQITVHS